MKRRDFHKYGLMMGAGLFNGAAPGTVPEAMAQTGAVYREPAQEIPVREFDVVVAGAGTAGVVAALAAARNGAKTILIEWKGYTGGTVTEGGTALHSYYNLWKAFPSVKKRQVVKGIPQEIIDRLMKVGGTTGHTEQLLRYDYDSVCTAVDVELYKLVTMEMLHEAGVFVCVNTLLTDAIVDGNKVRGVIVESRSRREAIYAKSFIDCTAYGSLSAYAGADYKEMNDYQVVNSMGVANVSLEKYYEFLKSQDSLLELAKGLRSGKEDQIIRLNGRKVNLPDGFREVAEKIGMSLTTTTVHDNYMMFIKINYKMPVCPTNRDATALAELELRQRQYKALQLFRKYVPGCEKALIARTSPSINIRRARLITCDYDISLSDVLGAKHFDDDIMSYGFHDSAPRLQISNGGTYGVPYKALRVSGIDNLLCAGMMITSNHDAHMSTRNTVCCMGQGQAAGAAAALCVKRNCGTRDLPYSTLRSALLKDKVYLED
jgi:hypothetical protein